MLADISSLPPSLSDHNSKPKRALSKRKKQPANAVIGLNSSMLKQFDWETSNHCSMAEGATTQRKKKKKKKQAVRKKKKK